MISCHSEDEKAYLTACLQLLEIKGEIAEIGVWEGETAKIIKEQLPNRKIHLFDTFGGIISEHAEENWPVGDYCCYEKDVRKNIGDDFIYHRGDVCQTKEEVKDGRFALVHFDLDIYIPLKDSMGFFYDRLNKNGIMLVSNCDDVHSGVTRAIGEFNKFHKKYSRYALYKK